MINLDKQHCLKIILIDLLKPCVIYDRVKKYFWIYLKTNIEK